ncbi:MAG: AI-2E family transporter [Microbacteriaceae bacterium]
MALFSRSTKAVIDLPARSGDDAVPVGMKIAGAWAWRILAVAGVLVVIGILIIQLREIIIPLMIAVLIAALLVPIVNLLVRAHWPRWLALLVVLIGTLLVVSGLIYLIVAQVRSGFPDLKLRSLAAFDDFKNYLAGEPFNLDAKELNAYIDTAIATFAADNGALLTGAAAVGTTSLHLVTGLLLTVFSVIFVLIDGKGIWAWIVRLFPRRARPAVDGAGKAGWLTLTTFVKVQIFVAFVDAVGIGLGAWILGLFFLDQGGFPLVIPIAIAVFLGSFIPVVGAVVTGTFAIFVALIFLGPFPALIMLGIVLIVQQVEGHILQPLVMGSAVKVHPLAVVFGVAAGAGIAGIVGALFAVPVVATANVMVNYVAKGKWRVQSEPRKKDVVSHV